MSPRQSHVEAAIKLADVLVKTLTSALGPPGTFAGELAGKGFDALLDRVKADGNRLKRQIADIADSITTASLAPYEFSSIAPNDLNAAAEAVADTIAAVPVDADLLRESGYTTHGLAAYYRDGAREILERAKLGEVEFAYDHILDAVSHQVLAVVRASPEAHAMALSDLNHRLEDVRRKLADPRGLVADAQSAVLDEYLLTYRLHVSNALLRRSFVTTGATRRSLRAGLAYVERPVVGPNGTEGLESLLSRGSRILVVGDPGQGKTTLLRRAYVRMLTGPSTGPIPIYLDLRELTELPADLDSALKRVARWLPTGPPGWVDRTIREGRAVVLLDAVDDLLADRSRRLASEEDLDGFLGMAGHSTVVVTARSGTLGPDLVERHGFIVARLPEPAEDQVFEQIQRWHEAVAVVCSSVDEQDWVVARGDELRLGLCQVSDLRGLGRDPLLCALLCETFLDSSYALPRDWIALVQKVLSRLAELDCQPADPVMHRRDAVMLVQRAVAVWAVHNRPSFEPGHLADAVAGLTGGHGAAELVDQLVFRGAILRRGPGGLLFVNEQARDHLAAGDLMANAHINLLREKAWRLDEPRLVVAAAGHGSAARATELIDGLLDDAANHPDVADALTVVAACGADAALALTPATRQRALDAAAQLINRGDTSGIEHPAIAPLALDLLVRAGQAGDSSATSMAGAIAAQIRALPQAVRHVIIREAGAGLVTSAEALREARPGNEGNGGT